MVEQLLNSILETRHLYQQNAAMRHGVPDPPRRVNRTVRRKSTTTPSKQPRTAPLPAKAQPRSSWLQHAWWVALVAAGLGAIAAIGVNRWMQSGPSETLLEFLEREGLSQPYGREIQERRDGESGAGTDGGLRGDTPAGARVDS